MSKLRSASLALLATGCIIRSGGPSEAEQAKAKYKTPPTFGDYVADIMSDPTSLAVIGKDFSFTAPLDLGTSKHQRPMLDVRLKRLDAGQVCFWYVMGGASIKLSTDEVAQSLQSKLAEHHFTVRALTSLDTDYRARPMFPVPAGGASPTVKVLSDEVKDVDNEARGTVERRRIVDMEYCAELAITPETKFIAVTLHDPDPPEKEYEGVYGQIKSIDDSTNRSNRRTWMSSDTLYLISIGGPS